MKTNCGSSPDSVTKVSDSFTESPNITTLKIGDCEILQNNWQVCPKCIGQGVLWYPPGRPWMEQFSGPAEMYECDICKGKKIISSITGKPPED